MLSLYGNGDGIFLIFLINTYELEKLLFHITENDEIKTNITI